MKERKKEAFKRLGLIVITLLLLSVLYSSLPQVIAQGYDDDDDPDTDGGVCCFGAFMAIWFGMLAVSLLIPILIFAILVIGVVIAVILAIKIINKNK